MSDDAQEFFDAFIEPAIAEFYAAEEFLAQASEARDATSLEQARTLALRRARTAAIELHQFADRVVEVGPSWAPPALAIEALRRWLMDNHCSRPDDVQVLHDVADAFKHASLKRPRKERTWVLRSDRAVVTTAARWEAATWDDSKWDVEQTIVEQDDSRTRALGSVLQTVREAWRRAMGS